MKKFWIGIFAMVTLLATGITGGVLAAQDTGGGENTAPNTILGRVAAILGLEEATVKDAFQQARKDQQTRAYKASLDRQVEKGLVTPEEADEQFLWFQSRPDSLTGSFRQGKHKRFGFARPLNGRKFGMRMHRRGSRWGGSDWSSSGWTEHDGHESGQREVAPTEPSPEPNPTSQ